MPTPKCIQTNGHEGPNNAKNLIWDKPGIKFFRSQFSFGALVGTVAFSLLRGLLFVARRPLVFLVVCNDLRGLFGRPLVVFLLGECSGGNHAEHRYHQKLSH